MKFQQFRKEKQEAYTRLMLRYLGHHGFSTVAILQSFFGLKDAKSVREKLKTWLRAELVEELEFKNPLGGRQAKIYKLTPNGMAHARSVGVEPREEVRASWASVAHSLFMQRVNIALLKRGYYGFEVDKQIEGAMERYGHYPDMVCRNREEKKIVIEAERTIKSKSRYQQLMADFMNAFRNGSLDAVFYVVPSDSDKAALDSTIESAISKPFERKGQKITIDREELRKVLKIFTLDELEATDGHFLRFQGFGSDQELRGVCMVHFGGMLHGKKVILLETLAGNGWTSVTNAVEEVAARALELLNEEQGRPNGFEWKENEVMIVEYWNKAKSLGKEQAFMPVVFEERGFNDPQWVGKFSGENLETLRNWLF